MKRSSSWLKSFTSRSTFIDSNAVKDAADAAEKQPIDAQGGAILSFIVFIFIWGLVVSVILFTLGIRYLYAVVDQDRAVYSTAGTAPWAHAEAARVLHAAHRVQDSIRLAVDAGVVNQTQNQGDNLEQVIAPIFTDAPFIRSVELALAGTSSFLYMGHDTGTDGRMRVVYRSNEPDCHIYGVQGCLEGLGGDVTSSGNLDEDDLSKPAWVVASEGIPNEGTVNEGDNAQVSTDGDAFHWSETPEILTPAGETVFGEPLRMSPVLRMLFRVAKREHGIAGFVGRVTLEIGGLTGEALQDEKLGDEGRVYLCDRSGTALAVRDPGEWLAVDNGQLIFRRLATLASAKSWASQVVGAVNEGKNLEIMTNAGEHISVIFLPASLSSFAVIVVAPSRAPFADSTLKGASVTCIVMAVLPYGTILLGLFLKFLIWFLAKYTICCGEDEEEEEEEENPEEEEERRRGSMARMRNSTADRIQSLWLQVNRMNFMKNEDGDDDEDDEDDTQKAS